MKNIVEYTEVLTEIADAVYRYRIEHNGFVPQEMFESIFPIVGQYESFGAIVLVGGTHFGFVQRSAVMGNYWEGKYQLPCMAVRPNDSDETLLDRLARSELLIEGSAWEDIKKEITILPGRTVQWEDERKTRCRTRRCLIQVNSLAELQGTWTALSVEDLHAYVREYDATKALEYAYIDHMVAACLWYLDPDRVKYPNADVDLRKYIPTMLDPYPLV